MIGLRKMIWLALLCTGMALWAFAQDESQGLAPESADTSSVTGALQSDTTASVEPDSSKQEVKPAGNVFSNLIKPLLFTGIVGGVLILLYTQRGS